MTGVMVPLVKEAKENRIFRLLIVYTLGVVISATSVGAVLAGVGHLVHAAVSPRDAAVAIVVAGVTLTILDLKTHPFAAFTIMRQTCPLWFRSLGPSSAFVFWGLDLGLGFSTIRVSSLYWVVVLTAGGVVSNLIAIWSMLIYALAVALTLWFSALRVRHNPTVDLNAAWALAYAPMAKRVSMAATLMLTFALILAIAGWS
jgi:hypothetical protein